VCVCVTGARAPVNEGCIINNSMFVVLLFAAVVRAGIQTLMRWLFFEFPLVHVNH
jgi:hypothetical protein